MHSGWDVIVHYPDPKKTRRHLDFPPHIGLHKVGPPPIDFFQKVEEKLHLMYWNFYAFLERLYVTAGRHPFIEGLYIFISATFVFLGSSKSRWKEKKVSIRFDSELRRFKKLDIVKIQISDFYI